MRAERALSAEAQIGTVHGNCKAPAVPGAQQGSSGQVTCCIRHPDVLGGRLGEGRLPAPLRQTAALSQRDRRDGAVLRQERQALLRAAASGGAPGQLCCLILQQDAAAWRGLWLQCCIALPEGSSQYLPPHIWAAAHGATSCQVHCLILHHHPYKYTGWRRLAPIH